MSRSPLLIGTTTERERTTRVGILRISVGSTLLLTGVARRVFGIGSDKDNAALRLVARLMGIRNISLGAWALMARDQDPDARRLCYQVNAVVDATDVLALAWAGITDKGLIQAGLMGSIAGGSALLAWLDLLQDLEGTGTIV